jgi:DNA-binding beta-propeller fold protein YncE
LKESKAGSQRSIPAGALLAGLFLVLCTACAGPTIRPASRLQWPPAPAIPKVSFVSEIRDLKDAGIQSGFWRRMLELVAGETDQRIGRPYGVYLDPQGRLLIVDTVYNVVHVMDGPVNSYSTIGQAGEDGTVFKCPIGVTGDDSGNVYITDSSVGMVYRYSFLDHTLKPFIQTLQRPTGIAFSRRKRLLYVADTVADRVAVFDLNGNARFSIGSTGSASGKLNHPTDLFIDEAGLLYITDPLNYRVQVFSAEGGFLRAFGTPGDADGEFLKPKGIAADSSGGIYVVDALSDTVKVYSPSGIFRFAFGSNGMEAGMFWQPSGIYIDRDDKIYVSDTYNRRVEIFQRIKAKTSEGKEDAIR